MSVISITEDAIKSIVREEEKEITCQVINLKKMKTTSRMSCDLSDGHFKIRAYITDPKVNQSITISKVDDNNAFITITSYGMLQQNQKPVGVIVHMCNILQHYIEQYGKPVDFLKDQNNVQANNKEYKYIIDEKKFKSYAGIDRVATYKKQQHKMDEENNRITQTTHRNNKMESQKIQNTSNNGNGPILKTPQKTEARISSTQAESMENYQKIMDLYPDFQNWQMVARLIKKSYREFVSQSGKGKLTKVLNLQFMDSTGAKITGAMFGDSANDFFNALKQDSIYIVSKGQIKQDQFNQNKGKNCSRYTLMFNRQSQFKICKNTELVPHSQNKMHDLAYISQHRNIGEQYDAVAILLSIQDQVEIPKDNKTLYKQVMEICDPVNELIMESIIWNKNFVVDERLIGKTVGLYGFRLNQFNEKLSLNSSYRSQLKVLDNHPYRKYEGKIDRSQMELLSEKKNDKNQIQEDCKNLKQLDNQVKYLEQGKQIRSTLTLILTFIGTKKWSYQSCPHCRRSAQANNRCQFCEKYIQQTIPRYKLNVELSDYCGSIWATGFQQLGSKLFADYGEGIKGLTSMKQIDRNRQFEKRLYQQFTVKITSKFDKDGQVKHTLNRVFDCNILHVGKKNIQRIKKGL